MKKRLLSLALCLSMALTMLPTAAWAAEAEGDAWDLAEGDLVLTQDGEDARAATGTTTKHVIRVESGSHKLTLTDADVDVSGAAGACALSVAPGASLELTVEGACALRSGAGKAGVQVPEGATLTIRGTGTLTAVGGDRGAGIGGGAEDRRGQDAGTVTIADGVTVRASGGGGGAGVGGGAGQNAAPVIAQETPMAVTLPKNGLGDAPTVMGKLTATDADGDRVSFVAQKKIEGKYGFLTVAEDGMVSYTVDAEKAAPLPYLGEGEDVIPVSAQDEMGGVGAGKVRVTVIGRNEPPTPLTLTPETLSVDEKTGPFEQRAQAAATDPDGDTLHYELARTTTGTAYGQAAIDPDTGAITYTLDPASAALIRLAKGQSVTETFRVKVTDPNGGNSEAQFNVTIRGVNDPPTLTLDPAVLEVTAAGTSGDGVPMKQGTATGADPEDTFAYPAFPGEDGHTENQTIEDGYGTLTLSTIPGKGFAEKQYTFTLNNEAPAVKALAAGERITREFKIQATDDAGVTVTETLTVGITGANDAPYRVGESASVSVRAPGVSGGNTPYAGKLTSKTVRTDIQDWDTGDVLAYAVDLAASNTANTPTTADVGTDADGWQTYATDLGTFHLDPGSGNFYFTLDSEAEAVKNLPSGHSETRSLCYKATDRAGAALSDTVTVKVKGANDKPTLTLNPAELSLTEDSGSYTATGTPSAADPDQGSGFSYYLTDVGLADAPQDGTFPREMTWRGTYGVLALTDRTDGSGFKTTAYTYTLDNDSAAVQALAGGATGTDVFHIAVVDNSGAFDIRELTVTVNGTKDPIRPENPDAVLLEVWTGESGLDGQSVPVGNTEGDFAVVSGDAGDLSGVEYGFLDANNVFFAGSLDIYDGMLTIDSAGHYRFTLDETSEFVTGLDVGEVLPHYVYSIAARDGGDVASVPLVVAIYGGNCAPTWDSESNTLQGVENENIEGQFKANDSWPAGDAETLTYSVGSEKDFAQASEGSYGTLGVNPNGAYVYALKEGGGPGTDTFTVRATDPWGAYADATVTVEVTGTEGSATVTPVSPVPGKPLVDPGPVLTLRDGEASVSGTVTVRNAPDGAQLTFTPYFDTKDYGSFSAQGRTYTFTPDKDKVAPLKPGEFALAIEKLSVEGGDARDVAVLIRGANDAPVLTVNENPNEHSPLKEDRLTILTDFFTVSDPENDPVTVTASGARYGSVEVVRDADGGYTYTYTLNNGSDPVQSLAEGQTVTDSFTLTARDSGGEQTEKTVTIHIQGTNDAPKIISKAFTLFVNAGGTVTGTMTYSDIDATDTHTATVQYNTGAAGASAAEASATGACGTLRAEVDPAEKKVLLTYTANTGVSGTDAFTVAVKDNKGGAASQTVTVTVTGAAAPADAALAAPAPVQEPPRLRAASPAISGGAGGRLTITGGVVYASSLGGGAGGSGGAAGADGGLSVQDAVLFLGAAGTASGTLPVDFTVEDGETLTVPAGTTLTIPEGRTLTVAGGGKLVNEGTIRRLGTLDVQGSLEGPGQVTGPTPTPTPTPAPAPDGGGSSNDGGSEDRPSHSVTTEKHEDGTTIKTETDEKTGAVTETTKRPDGSTTTVETTQDGTVTTTERDKAGNQTETVEKPDGALSTTETRTDGTKIQTETTKDGKTTSVVTVPPGKDEVKVTIPLPKKPTAGTVAVVVHPDGTREVVKSSLPSQDGLTVTLTEGAKLELIDNSKDFADLPGDHWAAEAVEFVTARELFSGTDADRFSPEAPASRAQLWTVLARLDGVDANGGTAWYEKGMAWAVENGVSDGANPDGPITREQLATMLWRFAGSPTAANKELNFTDADAAGAYSLDALAWAVENGILTGKGGGVLDPQGEATRAQVAAMIMRFLARQA